MVGRFPAPSPAPPVSLLAGAAWSGPQVGRCEHSSYQAPPEAKGAGGGVRLPPGRSSGRTLCLDHPYSAQVSLGASGTVCAQGRDCPLASKPLPGWALSRPSVYSWLLSLVTREPFLEIGKGRL